VKNRRVGVRTHDRGRCKQDQCRLTVEGAQGAALPRGMTRTRHRTSRARKPASRAGDTREPKTLGFPASPAPFCQSLDALRDPTPIPIPCRPRYRRNPREPAPPPQRSPRQPLRKPARATAGTHGKRRRPRPRSCPGQSVPERQPRLPICPKRYLPAAPGGKY
jgi:hypothetical protein